MPSATIQEQEQAVREKQFYVNDGLLPTEDIGLLQPVTLATPIEQMRQQYKDSGYLLVKGVIPREDVLRVRQKYFEMLSPTGCLAPGTKPVDGIFDKTKNRFSFPGVGAGPVDRDANGQPVGSDPETAKMFGDLSLQAHYEDWYKEELCRHPAIRDLVAKFTGWGDNTLSIRRTLLRNNMPQNKAIGVHYDQIFLRHGEDTFVTAWVPIGDISIEGGGLIYLEKGHDIGQEIESDFVKRSEAAGMDEEQTKSAYNANMMSGGLLDEGPARFAKQHKRRWLLTAYEAGDVVFHDPYAIHASCINHDPENVIRLGTDLRFVDSSRPWDTLTD